MPGIISPASSLICARCCRLRIRYVLPNQLRASSSKTPVPHELSGEKHLDPEEQRSDDGSSGAMTRRLQALSEDTLEAGGASARKAIKEAGFSEELKQELEKKIADASFRSEHAGAISIHTMPASAGKGTRDIAAARAWSGTESVEDASLRMLSDSHKPIRVPTKVPTIARGPPSRIDTGRPKGKISAGSRLASARERSALYEQQQGLEEQEGLSDEERAKFRQEMRMRFQPGARAVPTSIQGLTSLANERIEDAIARGQFKNLPDKGKKLERDYNANSPFINTTEYFLNKMIKKQEIVPPWIEKQQEVIAAATTFRRRLRADWKRHAARTIASRGGSLESQMKLAEEYAFSETFHNPANKKMELINAVDPNGHISQITLTGELHPNASDDAAILEEEIKIMEQTFNDDGSLKPPKVQARVTTEQPILTQAPAPTAPRRVAVPPFRDAQWEATERSYHDLAIQNLNALTRSYNLMAPNLAKKPYFSLERELRSCFADIAPHLAAAVRDRAFAPKIKGIDIVGHKPGGVLAKFSVEQGRIHDEKKPQYGFKEFWRDLFAKP